MINSTFYSYSHINKEPLNSSILMVKVPDRTLSWNKELANYTEYLNIMNLVALSKASPCC